jgi:hypothetical protein
MNAPTIDRPATARPALREISLYAVIVGVSLLIALNPVVTGLAIHLGGFHKAYLLVLDVCLVAIVGGALMYRRTARRQYFWLAVVVLCVTPAVLFVAELVLSYAALRYGAELGGRKVTGVYEADPKLGWRLIANGTGHHVNPHNFDATYVMDGQGHRKVAAATVSGPTVHVFGSSFTFGDGVNNNETALYILAEANRDRYRVVNYSVSGYGLDQMVFSLESNRDAIAPGDIVVLAPTPMSLSWNMIDKAIPCQATIRSSEYPVSRYPLLTEAGWQFIDLKAACGTVDTLLFNSPGLPIGGYAMRRHAEVMKAATIEHSDHLFAYGRRIVESRGAHFLPIMVVNVDECRTKKFSFDVSGLKAPIVSMMPYCPDDNALDGLSFPDDWHYTVKGNRWLADVLGKILASAEPRLR